MGTQKKLHKMLLSRRKKAKETLRKYGDAWLIVSSGKTDSNVDYMLGTHTFGTVVVLFTVDEINVLVSTLEKSFVENLPHIDNIETYYGRNEFISKMKKIIRPLVGLKILANFAAPEICPHASRLPFSVYKEIKFLSETYEFGLHSAGRFICDLRKTKTQEELDILKDSVNIATDILNNLADSSIIKPGTSEREIAAELYKASYIHGEPAFEVIVASGPNTANPHHVISDRKIKNNDIVYVDFGVRYLTMCSDITRVYTVGNPERKIYDAYEAVFSAQREAIASINSGETCSKPDKIARDTLEKMGYDPKLFSHSLGHALGVDVHDVGPPLSKLSENEIIVENTAYTVEPGLYFENDFGIRIEDDIIIYKNRIERLSVAPESPINIK